MRRIADAARTTWDRKMRIGGKALSDLTDEELEAELMRRRRKRGVGREPVRSAQAQSSARAAVERANVRQWYANLELSPGASLTDVQAAYDQLMKRYDPSRHAHDPAKHRAATELTRRLREAYLGLREHLART